MTQYTFTQLEDLWVQAGGNPQNKAMAAAVAEAESSGNSQSTNDNGGGSIDRGLWQINSGHGSLSTYDPLANARAAVQLSNGGSNWRPWCTAYSDGLCGTKGGTYLGANSPFMKFLNGASTGPLTSGGTNPNATVASNATGAAWYDWIVPGLGGNPLGGIASTLEAGMAGAISDILAPVGRAIMHTLFVVGGVVMMAYGFKLMLTGDAGGIAKRVDEPDPETEEPPKERSTNHPRNPVKVATASPEKKASEMPNQQEPKGGGGRRRAASPTDKPSTSAPGRHRGSAAREGRTSKAAAAASKTAKTAEVAAV